MELRRLGILFGVLDVKSESGMLLSWSTRASGLVKLIQSACEHPKRRIHFSWVQNFATVDQVGPGCVSIKSYHSPGHVSLTLLLPNASRRILQIWNKYELIRFGLPRVKRQGCCDPSGLTLSPQVDSSGIPWGDFKCIRQRWRFLWHKCSRLHLWRFNLNVNISLKLWSEVSERLFIDLKWTYLVLKVAETLEYYCCGYNKGKKKSFFKHRSVIELLTS